MMRRDSLLKTGLFALFAAPIGSLAAETGPGAGHASPVSLILISVAVILFAAKLGGALAERFRQPAVLGELVVGVALGNLGLFGFHGFDYLKTNEAIAILAEIGVILLLFEVGLESNIKQMMEVGASSFLAAILGVIVPILLGWGVSVWFLPTAGTLVHVFIGATLCATSVGITARVLKDLGKTSSKESRIILGAAVIDDVIGLVVLAGVAATIRAVDQGTTLSGLSIGLIVLKAVAFLVLAIWVGSLVSPRLFHLASRLNVHGMLLTTSVCLCFFLAWLANMIELAPIVGAFAAGLILDPVHYRDFRERGEHTIEELVRPLSTFLVPVFFVLMGVKVDLRTFGDVSILSFAFFLTVAAIIGKQACSLGVLDKGVNRLAVGVGMIPRGEVGLIFANIGAAMTLHGSPVISASTYSAVVIMVIVTTMVTPPAVKLALTRSGQRKIVVGS
jgi:Kef-type K+ transport system membrane component KefB